MSESDYAYRHADALEAALAESLRGLVTDALAARGQATLVLAGGRTPLPLYRRLAAMPLDALENLATLRMIDHGASESLASWLTFCATIKFAAAFTAAGYLLVAGTATLVQR